MGVTVDRKNMFRWKTSTHLCGTQSLILFIVFEVLLPTYMLDWILISCSFLKYLVIIIQTNISYFLPPF